VEVNETTGITSKLFLRYICVSANTINGITCSAPTVCYCITWYTAREERVGDNGEVASQLRLTRSSALLQLSVSQLSCTPTVPVTPTVRLSAQLHSDCPLELSCTPTVPLTPTVRLSAQLYSNCPRDSNCPSLSSAALQLSP